MEYLVRSIKLNAADDPRDMNGPLDIIGSLVWELIGVAPVFILSVGCTDQYLFAFHFE